MIERVTSNGVTLRLVEMETPTEPEDRMARAMATFQDGWQDLASGHDEALIITFKRDETTCNISSTGPPVGDLLIMQRIFNDWVDEEITPE